MKRTIFISGVFIILLISSCGLIKDNKGLINKWEINDYTIKLYKGRGIVGPIYNQYALHKSNFFKDVLFKTKTIGVSDEDLINCIISFKLNKGNKVVFNLCENQMQTNLPRTKTLIDSNRTVDIEVINIGKKRSLYLNNTQRNVFIDSWNKSDTIPFVKLENIYEFRVTENGRRKRIFYSDGYSISELGNLAVYALADNSFIKLFFN